MISKHKLPRSNEYFKLSLPVSNQRLPEQLLDELPNPKFTFALMAKWVFVRNYWYENILSPVYSFA